MSKREMNRIDILARLDRGRLTTAAAADLMQITLRAFCADDVYY